MCGIAGIFHKEGDGADRNAVRAMCRALTHRGPDDEGFFDSPGLSLGMRRLSIIDLKGGRQPLFNEDGSLVLVFNGEVYNYIELRRELLSRGHTFATQSDGEVILHLFEEKGLDALQELNGMYAFCLWDVRKKEGYLVRDRLGIKPLYYHVTPESRRLCFASEIKALLHAPVEKEVDMEELFRYLAYMYIPGCGTPFKNVRKLQAGSFLRFGAEGIGAPRRYWTMPAGDPVEDEGRLKEEFFSLLESSIELQSRSDVPVGVFLSGGLDSSLITAYFSKKTKSRVLSFNVKYEGAPFDESRYAELVAEKFGCEHKSVNVTPDDMLKELPRLVWHMDEPHADHAMVAAYKVSELAAKDVKVVLNGTGGDELLGGYPRYRPNAWPLAAWHKSPEFLRTLAVGMAERIPFGGDFVKKARFNGTPDDTYVWRLRQFKPYHLERFCADRPVAYTRDARVREWLDRAPTGDLNRYLYLDANFYMVDDLLLLLDKMTMAASIEGRVPLLDHRLVEWAFKMSGRWKVRGGETKLAAKRWLRGILPEEILWRPKLGFGAPMREWMKDKLFPKAAGLVAARPPARENLFWGLRGEALRERMRRLNFQQNYALLALEVWFRLYIDGESIAEVTERIRKS
ncbi:MAG TPA: asparagine synthase (glutamine-hydrolyzing) [Elusimicrobiota bacterium]|nr:asparagine synthase (glutamine-hydrolyzing) [Elusimicrobiota bacterium]